MKKFSIIVFIVLVLIVLSWFIAGFWAGAPDGNTSGLRSPGATVEILPLPDDGRDAPGFSEPEDGNEQDPAGQSSNPGTDPGLDPGLNPEDESDPDDEPIYPDDIDPIITTNETEEELNDRRSIMLMQAELLYDSGKFEEALELLRADRTLQNDETLRLEDEIMAAMG